MKALSFVCFVTLVLAATACSGSPTDPDAGHRVSVTIEKTDYYTGDTIRVDVTNLSDIELTFPGHFCPVVLQESRGGEWVTISGTGVCPASLQLLDAHGHVVFEMLVRDGLQGHYRLLLPAPVPMDGPSEAPLRVEFSVNATTM
jgi:hypothetical protein